MRRACIGVRWQRAKSFEHGSPISASNAPRRIPRACAVRLFFWRGMHSFICASRFQWFLFSMLQWLWVISSSRSALTFSGSRLVMKSRSPSFTGAAPFFVRWLARACYYKVGTLWLANKATHNAYATATRSDIPVADGPTGRIDAGNSNIPRAFYPVPRRLRTTTLSATGMLPLLVRSALHHCAVTPAPLCIFARLSAWHLRLRGSSDFLQGKSRALHPPATIRSSSTTSPDCRTRGHSSGRSATPLSSTRTVPRTKPSSATSSATVVAVVVEGIPLTVIIAPESPCPNPSRRARIHDFEEAPRCPPGCAYRRSGIAPWPAPIAPSPLGGLLP